MFHCIKDFGFRADGFDDLICGGQVLVVMFAPMA